MKQADSKIYNDWLERGERDFKDAKALLEDGENSPNIAFLCHQAAEKYLKGFLIKNNFDLKITHDLVWLNLRCREFDPEFEELADDCRFLNPFQTQAKYPLDIPRSFSESELKEALECAENILRFVKQKI